METWQYLCTQLASTYRRQNKLSYVHFIEPRYDRIEANKVVFYSGWSLPVVSNDSFRAIIVEAGIPCFSCGGWDDRNVRGALDNDKWDAVAFAKWFVSNPDLPQRILLGQALEPYDRSRFYGSWDGVRERGYVDYV